LSTLNYPSLVMFIPLIYADSVQIYLKHYQTYIIHIISYFLFILMLMSTNP